VRMGYEAEAAEIQEKYLARDYAGAAAAVPQEFIDRTALIGSVDRIADRMQAYADAGVTTLNVAVSPVGLQQQVATVRAATEAIEKAGLAS